MLGYLSLDAHIRQLWTSTQMKKNPDMGLVVRSIKSLLTVHQKACGDDGDAGGLSDRLQTLIDSLQAAGPI